MYAIIESGGLQFKVEKDSKVKLPKLAAESGAEVSIDKVLALSDGKNFIVGMPYVEEAQVKAKLLAHGKHDKVLIYKFKRRKNYRRKRGHRQDYSEVLVTEIVVPKLMKKEAAPEEKKPKAVERVVAPKKKVTRKKLAPVKARPKAKPKATKALKPKAKPAAKKKATKKAKPVAKKTAKPTAKKKTTRRRISRLGRKKTKG